MSKFVFLSKAEIVAHHSMHSDYRYIYILDHLLEIVF